MSQAAAILVNEANIDQLNDIAAAIHAVRPDIIVAPYSMADQVTAQVLGRSAKPAPTATQADIDAATGKPAQGKKGKGPAQVPKAGQAKEQVTTPNENERTKRTETQPPTDTGTPASVPAPAPQVTAVRAPGEGSGTQQDPYISKSGKFSLYIDKDGVIVPEQLVSDSDFSVRSIRKKLQKRGDPLRGARNQARRDAEKEFQKKFGGERRKKETPFERRERIVKDAGRADVAAMGDYGIALKAIALMDNKKSSLDPRFIVKEIGGVRENGLTSEARAAIRIHSPRGPEILSAIDAAVKEGGGSIPRPVIDKIFDRFAPQGTRGMGSIEKMADGLANEMGWDENDIPIGDAQSIRSELIGIIGSGAKTKDDLLEALDNYMQETDALTDPITRAEKEYYDSIREEEKSQGITPSEEHYEQAERTLAEMSEEELAETYRLWEAAKKDTDGKEEATGEVQPEAEGRDGSVSGSADSAVGEVGQDEGEAESLTPEDRQSLSDRINKLADDLDAPMAQRQSPERTALESEVASAQKALDKALKDINSRGQSLFSDQEGTDQTSLGDAFDNSTENYDRILGPLRARVAKAKAALAKYDKDSSEGEAAQGVLFQKPTDAKPTKTGKPRTDRVLAALRKLVPDIEIIAPKTKEEYAEVTKAISDGLGSTWGIYDPRTNKLYLNPSSPDLRQTLFHEAAHPIIIALAKNKPELFSKFYEQLRTERGGKYIKFGQQYSDLSEAAQMAEALAEFFGDVAAGKVPVSTKPDSLYQQFKNFIKDILAALGWDMRSIDLSKPTDVREFAAQMKKAFDKGIAIEGFAPLEGNKESKVALQDDADRLVDGWYSRLDQAVAAKGNTQSGADWMKWAEARAKEGMLSMEEVKWTGLADFLQGKPKVTPKEVREFLKENRVKVKVVDTREINGKKPDWRGIGGNLEELHLDGEPTGWAAEEGDTRTIVHRVYDNGDIEAVEEFNDREEAENYIAEQTGNVGLNRTKFSQYQLPGGTNYREVLVTLPVKSTPDQTKTPGQIAKELYGKDSVYDLTPEQQAEVMRRNQPSKEQENKFRSSHFDEPNILVHLRLNDRTDSDGKKVLFIEELQSDWGQKGKKEGFNSNAQLQAKKDELFKEYEEIQAESERRGLPTLPSQSEFDRFMDANPDLKQRRQDNIRRGAAAESEYRVGPTPSAPFVTSTDAWVELGMKQAIRMAVEGGYDRIAWTTGEQQNGRYDLSKQVEEVSWKSPTSTRVGQYKDIRIKMPDGKSIHISVREDGIVRGADQADLDGKRLDEVLGKDVADRIMAAETGNLSGDGLKVGGSGMKGFYDKILPNVAKKVGKKLGGDGRVGEVGIGASEGVQITERKAPSGTIYDVSLVSRPGLGSYNSRAEADAFAAKRAASKQTAQQSITITPEMRNRVGLGVPLMQRAYGPIPTDTHKAALNAVAASVRAGDGLSNAIAKGMKEVRKSDWYKALDAIQQAQVEADFKAPIKALATPVDKKPSTAPKKLQKQVNEQQSGLAPRKKILVDEKAALRDQILMAARVAKEAARSGAIAGEIHGRREERSAAAKAAEKARKEADMAAQKRTDQGYSFGLAEGRTAGEIAGKREGRKEGAKEAIDRIKEARKAFDRDVALALGGKGLDLSLVQSRSIARAAAKVDPSNDMQVSRFINYAMKVVENADWADQVAKARSAKRKAQAAARNKKLALNHREALQAAADVDVNLIDDPVVYTDAVRRYLAATAPTTTERYAPADTKAMLDLMEKLQGQVQKAYKELLKEEYGIDDVGELSAKELYDALAAEDIDDFAANFDAAKRQELEERVAKMAEYRKMSLQEYQNADITADQQKMLTALKGANIDRMNLQQQADYIRYVDNIVTNDVFYGAAYGAAIAKNSAQIEDALGIAAKNPVKRLFSPDAAKVGMSQSDAFRFFFGMRPVSAQIQNRMGVGDFIRGKKQWANQSKELGKKMTDFYNGLRKKYKNTYNEGLMLSEGMVSFAIQNVPGQDADTSLAIRKAIIEQDIKVKEDSRGALSREGELAQIVYNEILRDAKTHGEVMANLKKVYPAAYESVEFLKSVSRPYRDVIKQHTADTWNVGGDYNDPNYIPIRLPNAPNSQAPLSPDGPRNITRPTLRPKQAKGTIERQKYRGLPTGKMIDYNVRHNTFSALSDDLYDLNTSEAQMRVSEFMKMPDANTVFGSRENASFMSEMLQKFMVAQYQTNDEESKYINAVANTMRSWATVRALGGVLQAAKQLPEAFMQASVMLNGRADRMFINMMRVPQASALLDKYAIGDRAGIQGGSRWEGAVKRHTSELEAAFRNNALAKFKANVTEKIGQALMASLSASDSLAAKGAWMALYEQERGRQGHAVTSWDQEAREHDSDQQRQDAALYAENMVDQVMVSSDPAKMAAAAKKGTEGGKNLVKAVLLPFSQFSLQAASRRMLDLSELYAYGKLKIKGDPKADDLAPGAAARSLLASTIGTATFLASSIYVVGFLRDALGELWEDSFDDDDEGTENLIFATTVLQAMYMMGIMDVDIFRSAQKGQQRRLSYEKSKDKENFEQTEAEKKRVRNMKMFMTRLGTEQIPYLNALQPASDGVVDFINKMQYNTLVENNDPSVRNKDGSVKKFESWQKDPANTMLYRMGQGWDKDRVPLGMIDVLLQNKEAAMRQYNLLQKTSDENAAKAAAPKKPKVEATSRFR
jgi:hypothetical protein